MKKRIKLIALLVTLFVFVVGGFNIYCEVYAAPRIPTPKLSTIVLKGSNTVVLKWNKVRNAKKYLIYCSEDGAGYEKIASTEDKIYVHKGLQLSTRYSYKIKAVAGKNKSKASKVKRISTASSGYLLDIVKPYKKAVGYEEYNRLTFSMAGDEYSHGFTNTAYGNEAEDAIVYFNLHGDYRKLSFVAGDVSGGSAYNIIIYTDGEPAHTVTLSPNGLPTNHTVNIEDCSQLAIGASRLDGKSSPYYLGGSYGIGELKVYK